MNKILFILFATLLLAGCKTPKLTKAEHKDAFSNLHWIAGEWEKQYNFGKVYEKWEKINDSTYQGVSKLIYKKGYEPYSEKYEIKHTNQKVFFIIKNLTDENTNKPQKLELIRWKRHEFIFANEDASEFPQEIAYKLMPDKKLIVTNSGKDEGKNEKDQHILEKIKETK